ncbi:hypothetical protein DFJ73DRAFT_568807 [Zopfochytrium polystomum]|nr:hypothetical protein DFJ73DRAFT_568807 [Zopfochytrium polystomum]
MQTAIWKALRDDPTLDRTPWFVSITEREVVNGILTQSSATELQCLGIRREFDKRTLPKELPEGFFAKGEDAAMQTDLWRRVKQHLPPNCVVEYSPAWHRRLLTAVEREALAHAQFAAGRSETCFGRVELKDKFFAAVLAAHDEQEKEEEVEEEEKEKEKEKEEPVSVEVVGGTSTGTVAVEAKAAGEGKKSEEEGEEEEDEEEDEEEEDEEEEEEEDEETRQKRIAAAMRRFVVLYGSSGSGKTSMMSFAAVQLSKVLAERRDKKSGEDEQELGPVVIIRMCGTTADSSSARSLMTSIAAQIRTVKSEPDPGVAFSFADVVEQFHDALALATKESPIHLFIDSLDQLTDENLGRSQIWKWLPRPQDLPAHAHITLSVLEDSDRYQYGILPSLQLVLQTAAFVHVPLMAADESMTILLQSLTAAGRTITPRQKQAVERAIPQNSAENAVSALHVRLLFDVISKWSSFDDDDDALELPRSVESLVQAALLAVQKQSCGPFIRLIMQLMLVSRDGVSQQNLADIVSTRDDILGEQGKADCIFQYNTPPIRYVPPLVFANWRRLIRDFVVERGVNGVTVLGFFHRQFKEVAERLYLESKREREEALSLTYLYFSGQLAEDFSERNIAPHPLFFAATENNASGLPNMQRLREVVHALIELDDPLKAAEEICSLEYVKAKATVSPSFASDLLNELTAVEQMLLDDIPLTSEPSAIEELSAARKRVRQFYIFAFGNYQAIVTDPSLCTGLAWNYPTDHPVHLSALELHKTPAEAAAILLEVAHSHNPTASNSSQGTISFDSSLKRENIDKYRLVDINSPSDSSIFAVAQRSVITIYDRLTLRERFSKPIDPPEFWTAVGISADTTRFAAASSDGQLAVCLCSDGVEVASTSSAENRRPARARRLDHQHRVGAFPGRQPPRVGGDRPRRPRLVLRRACARFGAPRHVVRPPRARHRGPLFPQRRPPRHLVPRRPRRRLERRNGRAAAGL